ncbi:MAG TPA: LysR family transcriptional regulator [Candidatus Brachybacterium merdavium]|uniref:LysR family transcriptional regulator n=1 Tax=Candidatus Brachybacterium merdavium TaxID=2838513 RepID=A0A9D2LAS7_9MICO|nr:LysR family transcriptional regulator [Candidatus Brachybacterium merdavium]
MLDPTRLRVLRSVVETGSIRASAEALGYTPSAVSQHLSILRRETGLELLERSGRGVRVTETARAVAQEAGKVLDALDALDHRVADLRAGRTGTLHFGYATSVAATWVPELAREVRQRFPDLGLGLALRDCGGPEGADDGLDIVFAEDGTMSWGGEWVHHDVLEEGYVALVSQDHPLADRAAVGLKELAEESWATDDPLDSRWFQRIGSACKAAGFSPSVAANPSDFGAVVGFVATGEYVSVQPSLAAQSLRSDVVAIPIEDPSLRRRLSVHVRRALAGNPAAQFIVEQIHAAAARRVDDVPGVVPLGPGAVVR